MKLTCKLTMLGKEFEKVKMKYGVFAGLSGIYKNSAYCIKEDCLFYLEDGILNLVEGPISDERISELEKRYLADICKRKKGEYWAEFRKKAFEARGKKSRLWLFCDRMTSAEDSAEELFRYINENPVEGVETAFIIRADSPDYERLRALGRVIPFDSDEHYSAMLEADKVISSAADAAVIQPFGKGHRFVKDLINFDFIFLQHGVIKETYQDGFIAAVKILNFLLHLQSAKEKQY